MKPEELARAVERLRSNSTDVILYAGPFDPTNRPVSLEKPLAALIEAADICTQPGGDLRLLVLHLVDLKRAKEAVVRAINGEGER